MNILSLFGQTYTYTDSTAIDTAANAGAVWAGIGTAFLIVAAMYVITALCLGRIFKKAGVQSWKAWIPIYNSWVLLELGGQKGFWAVLALVPFVSIVSAVFMWIAMHNIGLKLGKSGAFVILGIFLPIVWMIWLAVDSSKWQGAGRIAADPQTSTDTTPPAAI